MCGIAGIVEFALERSVDLEVLARMRDSMVHRGPDGSGLWRSRDGATGLAHRRLSIIDTSHLADQPMASPDGDIVVTFNGEIYNHQSLRQELVARGHAFVTHHSDTEVLVHGFREWGMPALLTRLQGMFGFALWDGAARRLYLARDRLGVKPVYFAFCRGAFVFASEIKALLQYPRLAPELSPQAMNHYLSFMTTPAPMTMFRGIFKLPPGTWLSLDAAAGAPRLSRWWEPLPGQGIEPGALAGLSPRARQAYLVDGIRERLETAVQRRLVADVPFGALLSGGLDSTAIVALMSRLGGERVKTFTVGFSEHPRLNELEHARMVARRFGTDHHEVMIGASDMAAYLDDLVYQQDEPLADWVCVPLYFVSRLARDRGVKVVQVGEGSDEQFAGYPNYLRYLRLYTHFWRPFSALPRGVRAGGAALAGLAYRLRPALAPMADMVERAARDREPFWTGAPLFWDVAKRRLLAGSTPVDAELPAWLLRDDPLSADCDSRDSFSIVAGFRERLRQAAPDHDLLTRMIHSELRLRLPELLLMRVDKITMSTSLEARVPFLDHELVEFTMDIPQVDKVAGNETKRLLKLACAGLVPNEVIRRPKQGFGAPMMEWLRGDFGRMVESRVLASPLLDSGMLARDYVSTLFVHHRSGRHDMSKLLWGLFNLTSWYECWIGARHAPVGSAAASVPVA